MAMTGMTLLNVNAHSDSDLELKVNDINGNFIVSVNGDEWFHGDEISVRNKGQLYSTKFTDEYKLQVISNDHDSNHDQMGAYELTSLLLTSVDMSTQMRCDFRLYENTIIFEQSFPLGMTDTSSGDMDGLISSFPTFTTPTEGDPSKGYVHWLSWHSVDSLHSEFVSPVYGLWGNFTVENSSWNMAGGISGTGVTAITSPDRQTTFVLSPLTGAMSQSHAITADNKLGYGIMGTASEIPQLYSQSTILFLNMNRNRNANGLNNAMANWGTAMRSYYNVLEASASVSRDVALSYLGYSTDNGMYYYYNTDFNDTATYDATLKHLYEYSQKIGVNYKYILLDSWWYYRANSSDSTGNNAGSGVKNWVPRPEIFPDGIEALTNYTGWLVQAHNRYWADDNVYAIENGGSYDFGLNHTTFGALPFEEVFWYDLFSYPTSHWNLKVYEQDWMNRQVDTYYPAMVEQIGLSEQWLYQMAAGAKSHEITIQYCMPNVRHMLASLEVNSKFRYHDSNIITQTRASNDHKPSMNEDQWRIGPQSMLIHAVGLTPSKDGFWSTKTQLNNPYGLEMVETYPAMQSLVATMSTGPVQLGDGIGFADVELISRSCRDDGLLLQPNEPMMPIDACLYQSIFDQFSTAVTEKIPTDAELQEKGPIGDIWYTFSRISSDDLSENENDLFVWDAHYLAVLTLQHYWSLTLQEFHSIIHSRHSTSDNDILFDEYWVIDTYAGDKVATLLSIDSPLLISSTDLSNFKHFIIVPKSSRRSVTLLGEMNKWTSISTSGNRFSRIYHHDNNLNKLSVDMVLVHDETVTIGFIQSNGELIIVNCTANMSLMTNSDISSSNENILVNVQITSDGVCNTM